jgi:hypothetical protein
MNDTSGMQKFDSLAYLLKYVPYHGLRCPLILFDPLVQVTTLYVLHHDAYLLCVFEHVQDLNNTIFGTFLTKQSQQIDFCHQLLPFQDMKLSLLDYFDRNQGKGFFVKGLENFTEASSS